MQTIPNEIYSVTQLTDAIANSLTNQFSYIWLQGEISNFSQPSSGHWYFSLKDNTAQIRAAMFRQRNQYCGFQPADGLEVLLKAKISLYKPRGDLQLLVEHIEAAGEGALRQAFELLKQKLQAAGLFAAERKQAIPAIPAKIGIISSITGAAVQDALQVLRRRYPLAAVILLPVAVQGAAAADEIVSALTKVDQLGCDVVLLLRGGGSLEDLQAFNSASVAYAIANCKTPVITGIGHETDTTIADWVADLRAPTPSAAAELAVPDSVQLIQQIQQHAHQLQKALNALLQQQYYSLQRYEQRLQAQHPQMRLYQQLQQLDEQEKRLQQALSQGIQDRQKQLLHLQYQLQQQQPKNRLERIHNQLNQLQQRLLHAAKNRLQQHQHQLQTLQTHLDAVSPLAILQRGYAIVSANNNHKPLFDPKNIARNTALTIRLAKGEFTAVKTD